MNFPCIIPKVKLLVRMSNAFPVLTNKVAFFPTSILPVNLSTPNIFAVFKVTAEWLLPQLNHKPSLFLLRKECFLYSWFPFFLNFECNTILPHFEVRQVNDKVSQLGHLRFLEGCDLL